MMLPAVHTNQVGASVSAVIDPLPGFVGPLPDHPTPSIEHGVDAFEVVGADHEEVSLAQRVFHGAVSHQSASVVPAEGQRREEQPGLTSDLMGDNGQVADAQPLIVREDRPWSLSERTVNPVALCDLAHRFKGEALGRTRLWAGDDHDSSSWGPIIRSPAIMAL